MKAIKNTVIAAGIAVLALSSAGCATMEEIKPVDNVDLERFMGDWYVIAHIPTFIEDEAYNAVERYELAEPDKVNTTFFFNNKSFEGERKEYTPTGFVEPGTGNAIWGMQFIWPFKGDFRIASLSDDYSLTIIARNRRDYVWIMAREPIIPDSDYDRLVAEVAAMGYDLDDLRKVPQQPSDQR